MRGCSKIAEHVATTAPAGRSILIDAFAGPGGNTIAFARSGKWKRVYAIEKDSAVLQCAKHNAKIYGVEDKITWFEGDCFHILKNQLKDLAPYSVVFGSPPWGGMSVSSFLFSLRSSVFFSFPNRDDPRLTPGHQGPVIATTRFSASVRWNRIRWKKFTENSRPSLST
jgi:hypothetical protein